MVTSGRITFKISLHQLKHKSLIRSKKKKKKKKKEEGKVERRSWTTVSDAVRSTANTINSKTVNKCTSVVIYIISDYNPRKYHIFQAWTRKNTYRVDSRQRREHLLNHTYAWFPVKLHGAYGAFWTGPPHGNLNESIVRTRRVAYFIMRTNRGNCVTET